MSNILTTLPPEMIEEVMKRVDVRSVFKSMITCKAMCSEGVQQVGAQKLKRQAATVLRHITLLSNMMNGLFINTKYTDHFVISYLSDLLYKWGTLMDKPLSNKKMEVDTQLEIVFRYVGFETGLQAPEIFERWSRITTVTLDANNNFVLPEDLRNIFQVFKECILGIKRSFSFTLSSCEQCEENQNPSDSVCKYKYVLRVLIDYNPEPLLRFELQNVFQDNYRILSHLQKMYPTAHMDNYRTIVYSGRNLGQVIDAIHSVVGNEMFTDFTIDNLTDIYLYTYVKKHAYNPFSNYGEFDRNSCRIKSSSEYYAFPSSYTKLLSPIMKIWRDKCQQQLK